MPVINLKSDNNKPSTAYVESLQTLPVNPEKDQMTCFDQLAVNPNTDEIYIKHNNNERLPKVQINETSVLMEGMEESIQSPIYSTGESFHCPLPESQRNEPFVLFTTEEAISSPLESVQDPSLLYHEMFALILSDAENVKRSGERNTKTSHYENRHQNIFEPPNLL